MSKIVLQHAEPNLNANSEELASVIIQRLGLTPRKKGSIRKLQPQVQTLWLRLAECWLRLLRAMSSESSCIRLPQFGTRS